MKFYGNGIVWDGQKNRPLCEFKNGEFDTSDNCKIEKLIKAGYSHEAMEKKEPAKQAPRKTYKSRGR